MSNLKITLSLPAPLIRALRKAAERDRRTMSSVTVLALESYLQGRPVLRDIVLRDMNTNK